MRDDPFIDTAEKHDGELKSFGTVQRHQRDRVAAVRLGSAAAQVAFLPQCDVGAKLRHIFGAHSQAAQPLECDRVLQPRFSDPQIDQLGGLLLPDRMLRENSPQRL